MTNEKWCTDEDLGLLADRVLRGGYSMELGLDKDKWEFLTITDFKKYRAIPESYACLTGRRKRDRVHFGVRIEVPEKGPVELMTMLLGDGLKYFASFADCDCTVDARCQMHPECGGLVSEGN